LLSTMLSAFSRTGLSRTTETRTSLTPISRKIRRRAWPPTTWPLSSFQTSGPTGPESRRLAARLPAGGGPRRQWVRGLYGAGLSSSIGRRRILNLAWLMRCSLKCGLEVKPTLQHLMSRTRNKVSRWSFHAQKFDDEGQLRIRRDRAGVAALAVGEV